jgi:hypothetical protein
MACWDSKPRVDVTIQLWTMDYGLWTKSQRWYDYLRTNLKSFTIKKHLN